MGSARHVITRMLNPSFLSYLTSNHVASTTNQSRHQTHSNQTRHQTHSSPRFLI